MADYRYEEKEGFDGKKVRVLAGTFDEGKPDARYDWKIKLATREEKIKYLKTALRYWYSNEWYGSEKNKQGG